MTDNPAMSIELSNFKRKEHYKLCPEKLKKAPARLLPYVVCSLNLAFSGDAKYFHLLEPYLDIPEKPKTVDEILEGLDNKLDTIVDSYRWASKYRQEMAEKAYDETFRRIDSRFRYAKEHNEFAPQITLSYGNYGNLMTAGSNAVSWDNPFGKDPSSAGHYQIASNLFLPKAQKPSWLQRFAAQRLLGWQWADSEGSVV